MENNNIAVKTQKTAALLAFTNLLVTPIYFIDSKIGLTATIALNATLIYQLHELGKRRRPFSNAFHAIHSIFASQANVASNDMENTYRNIINGGAALVDEIESMAMEANRHNPRR